MSEVPNEPFLKELNTQWQTNPNRIYVVDGRTGQSHSIDQLLRDIVQAREQILAKCTDSVRAQLLDPLADDVFMSILADPGYTFVVVFLAIFSIGAVSTVLSPAILPEESKYFQSLSKSTLLVVSKQHTDKAREIVSLTGESLLVVQPQMIARSKEPLTLSSNPPLNPKKGGVVLFTSGTTGMPKGVLLNRYTLYHQARSVSQTHGYTSDDVSAVIAPVHYIGGILNTNVHIYSGITLEFPGTPFTPQWFWQRVKVGDMTCIEIGFPKFHSLITDYHKMSSIWDASEREAILAGIRKFKCLETGSTQVTQEAKSFWHDLTGKQLAVRYGLTETVANMAIWKSTERESAPYGCVGSIQPGFGVRISDEGEILIKSEAIFTRYLSNDPNKTKEAFTTDNYFKTGDLGRLDGNKLYILGRASTDIIRFLGWKIFGPEVEEALLSLSLFSLVIIVAIPDTAAGQRVGALVSFRDSQQPLDLAAIRKLLAEKGVNAYKLPTIFYVLKDDDVVPRTVSAKVVKPRVVEQFFSPERLRSEDVEVWDLARKEEGIGSRAFDWAGI